MMPTNKISDAPEREDALDPARSFIVEAPAGSGKTGLLTQRYLRLLTVANRPEAVIAMTFTRKAAAEMKERVEKALLHAQNGIKPEDDYQERTGALAEAALGRDRACGWNLLADTSRLQIQTIDSLCAMLARQMPLASGFGGFGDVVEDAGEMYRAAARRAMGELAAGDTEAQELLRRVSLHFDNDLSMIQAQIARMLARRDQWPFLESTAEGRAEDFRRLLLHARSALESILRERRTVDFTEITRAAIQALGPPENPTDLLYWLDYRIEHLLVDEFQDTSRAQYELLAALTREWSDGDGRSLFLVGDPMQSIYRFRQAEVGLFLRAWQACRLGSVRLYPLRLRTNFRSTPEIVRWTQRMFAPILNEDDAARGAMKLRPAEAARPEARVEPRLIPLIDDDGREEAKAVVRIAREAPDGATLGILVRNRAHLARILPALREAEIAYEAVEIERLGEQQHILDLLSLTRALLHPGDRTAWLACLRAPWCGLSLHDLSALAEGEPERTVFDLLSDPAKVHALSMAGRLRVIRVQEILADAIARVGRGPLCELVERAWIALGGPDTLEAQSHREDAETFLALLETIESGGTIDDLSVLQERLEYLYAKPRAEGARVQVMTIHQAKGLEFDTVILPRLERGSGSVDRDLLIWTELPDGEQVLLAAQPRRGETDELYKQVLDEIEQKEAEERKRLFYVAVTRAKNELFLLGNAVPSKRNKGCNKPGNGTLLRLIWDCVKEEFESARRQAPAQQMLFPAGQQEVKTILRRLPANWHPAAEPPAKWMPELAPAAASARKVTYEWVSNTGRHAGTVTHELLKRIAREGAEGWSEQRVSAMKPLLESELLRYGVAQQEIEAAAGRVVRAVSNTLKSERGRWILASHGEAHSEWEISGRVSGRLVNGTVDRLFRDEQGRLWIVDFKTSAHEGGRVVRFLNEQQRRYRPQLESYAALVTRMAKGPVWLGLYFPLLDAWREWQFEEEAVKAAH